MYDQVVIDLSVAVPSAQAERYIAVVVKKAVARDTGIFRIIPYQYGRTTEIATAVFIYVTTTAISANVIDCIVAYSPVAGLVQIDCAVIVTFCTIVRISNGGTGNQATV